jgi:vancomycin resistance protein YoaR
MKHLPDSFKKPLLYSFFFGVISVFLLSCFIIFQSKSYQNSVYPHVFVDSIDFGGKSKENIEEYFNKKNAVLNKVRIITSYKSQEVATFSAEILELHYDGRTLADQAYSIGRSPLFLSSLYQRVKTMLGIGSFYLPAKPTYTTKPIEDYIGDLSDKYNKPAENALFNYENGKVTAFKIEKNGIAINQDLAIAELSKKLDTIATSKTPTILYTITDSTIKPEVTLSAINDFGITEEIARGVSNYSGSIPERVYNVLLASSKFNGVLIPKGSEFSFDKIIGDISSQSGYKPAYVISNGRTVLGDGGGVCQVSTTLFRAALNAGLPITERHAHAYRVHYYENDSKPGLDATIFSPTVDFKFKNDTPEDILIQMEVDKENNILTFIFYGKKDNRMVTLSEPKVYDVVGAPEPLYQDDPTLKRGIVKQVDWAAGGAKSVFHYHVEKDSKTIIDQDFYSVYQPWKAVYLVGVQD